MNVIQLFFYLLPSSIRKRGENVEARIANPIDIKRDPPSRMTSHDKVAKDESGALTIRQK